MKLFTGSTVLAVLVVLAVLFLMEVDLTEGQQSQARRNRRQNGQNANRRNRSRGRNRGSGRRGGRRGGGRRGGGGRGRQSRWERYGCDEIYLPMCKGLVSYTHTKLPNQFNHTTQAEVFRHLEMLTAYMDHSCSRNVRLMACSTYLPKCHGRRPGMGPCKRTCDVAKRKCHRTFQRQWDVAWDERFSCQGLPNRRCVRPMRDTRCRYQHPQCVRNQAISACGNLTFEWGTLPNMFSQCHIQDINLELRQYETLQATNCHPQLNFLLCGVHSPFCVRNEVPFTFPCRELCDEIRLSCEADYRRLNHNLPWPHKLQCHRYPTSDNTDYQCVMPTEGPTFGANVGGDDDE